MDRRFLNGNWNLKGRSQKNKDEWLELSAQVPGCAQLALQNVGLFPKDLFLDEGFL